MPSLKDCLSLSRLPDHVKRAVSAEAQSQRRNGATDDLSAATAAVRRVHRFVTENRNALAAAITRAATSPARPPRSFRLPYGPAETPDVLNLIASEGGMMSRAEAGRRGKLERNADLWDDAPTLKGVHHQAVFGGRQLPDQMAAGLLENHGIGDGTAGTMFAAVRQALQGRASARAEGQRQAVAEKQAVRFEKDAMTERKGAKELNTDSLNVGDVLTIHGESSR